MSKQPLTDASGEVRELDEEDIGAMRPAAEVLPADLLGLLPKRRPGQRGPAKKPAKRIVTLRVAPSVLDAYRATGPGWQTRMADVLERHRPTQE
jgi:uncharacterized protein (DUF4415 family)